MKHIGKYIYTFHAKCINVVDGDTIDVEIDMGFNVIAKRRVRFLDVDTPERGEPNYKESTNFVKERILDKNILIQTYKSDTFNRYLARIFYVPEATISSYIEENDIPLDEEENIDITQFNMNYLNEELLNSGLIKPNSRWNNMHTLENNIRNRK